MPKLIDAPSVIEAVRLPAFRRRRCAGTRTEARAAR
jgi:hypothetical protein